MLSARPARVGAGARAAAALLAAGCLTLLAIASALHPDPRGLETHTQLGLFPCGWYTATGYPCPTCGMTTAFAAAAHGGLFGLRSSFVTQPFGALLALSTAVTFWGALHVALLGSRLGSIGDRLLRPRVVVAATTLLLAAWVYKAAVVRGWNW